MLKIKYRQGSVIEPVESEKLVIAHSCNDLGFGSAGVIVPIKNKWPQAYEKYVNWFNTGYYHSTLFGKVRAKLGEIQNTKVSTRISVCYAIGQTNVGCDRYNIPPFRYEAWRDCLLRLNEFMIKYKYERLCIPRVGCGLGGADWCKVEAITNKYFQLPVTVYDLPSEKREDTYYIS